ncbi:MULTISPECIES: MFS transporter [Mesonia]|mgnify:CR=1 FL=1|uniref:Inner membrane protein YbjJ n=1 Tax=Mesonia oceanica TaxID=2687242 RepID=A0AC61YAS2_9FLAO|nr:MULTISPECIES: MFS transporter [Mesonia]MBJ96981.1 MFS transporter [Flavobacteriaceae bacterium]MAN25927.1 MFS transporter [Mesonia sp.]MAN26152.1 MFS transporter [Mesonia sp.]MAQ39520.1 MFS transporter [Mesonia sp.]VVV01594.1 Inner membrane protein YbjJ [Mesonia oceanica]
MQLKVKQRIALSTCFFLSGFCFSSWASRIPTIKTIFNFSEADLGNLLLVMPIASLIGLPISGWMVSKFSSRNPLILAMLFFAASLLVVGYTTNIIALVVAVSVFSFCMRILNIFMNTQTITLQKKFKRKIIGSFHGIWSAGGLTGVAFCTLLLKLDISIQTHMLLVTLITVLGAITAYFYLLKNDKSEGGNKIKLGKPDPFIFYLGILIFFASVCEGGMFDWSSVYFEDVVGEEIFTLGYFTFMVFMALSRFSSDRVIEKIGMQNSYYLSSGLIVLGIAIVILLPYLWPALVGFSLIGLGVAAVIPMIFTSAGDSKKYSAGMAISIISTYGILGRLLGPPIIGYLAELFSLKLAFLLFLICGLMLIPFSRKLFTLYEK